MKLLISRVVEHKAWFRLPLECSWASVKLAKHRHLHYVVLGTMGYPRWPLIHPTSDPPALCSSWVSVVPLVSQTTEHLGFIPHGC